MAENPGENAELNSLRVELDWLVAEVEQLRSRVRQLEGTGANTPPMEPKNPQSFAASPAIPPIVMTPPGESPVKTALESLGSAVRESLGEAVRTHLPRPPQWTKPAHSYGSATNSTSPRSPMPTISWEAVVGGRWMTWVGAFTLLVAVGFTIQWAVATFQAPPWLQVAAFHVLAVGLVVGGLMLWWRKLPIAGEAFVGLGIFTMYAAAFAALHHYHLWSETTAFAECAAITALAVGLALYTNSAAVVLLGGLGGYLTPIITSTGSGNYVGLFSYLAFLNVALVACAAWRGWSFIKPLALAATALMFLFWIVGRGVPEHDNAQRWNLAWLAALHAGIFLLGSTLPPLLWRQTSRTADLLALCAGSAFFMGYTWLLFHDLPEQNLAFVSWGLSALHGALFAATYARLTNSDRMPRVHLALALWFFTLAIPLQLNDASDLGVAWCLEGLVFTAVGVYFADRQLFQSALLVFGLAAVRLFGVDFRSPPRLVDGTFIDFRFMIIAVSSLLASLAGASYWLIPHAFARSTPQSALERSLGGLLLAAGNVALLLALDCQFTGRTVLVLWTLNAAAIWGIAFWRNLPEAQMYGIALALGLVGLRAIQLGASVESRPDVLWNPRFFSLTLLALFYLVAGYLYYRTTVQTKTSSAERGYYRRSFAQQQLDEAPLDTVLSVIGHGVLLIAITWEIDVFFNEPPGSGWARGNVDHMAHLAAYSIVWAMYAAAIVALGFVLRYPLWRKLGLFAFGPIVLKVFFIDLASLRLLPRVLALAVLGMTLIGVSILYQKFASRVEKQ